MNTYIKGDNTIIPIKPKKSESEKPIEREEMSAPNYFDDDLLATDDQINYEEQEYDDDETFGDTGPLNDEWENQHTSLAHEHEGFVVDNKIRDGVQLKRYDDQEDLGDDGSLLEDDEDYRNGNGKDADGRSSFFSDLPPVNNNNNNNKQNRQQQQQSNAQGRTVGMFSSLSLYDDKEKSPNNNNNNNQVDNDQLESMFKIAMGEIPTTSIPQALTPHNSLNNVPTTPQHHQQQQQPQQSPIDPLKKLFQSGVPQQSPNKLEALKGAYSLSDLEAKFEQQSQQQSSVSQVVEQQQENVQQQQQQPQTPQGKNNINNNNRNSSPSRPGFTLGDAIPGNREYQQHQRILRDQARDANWNQHQSPRGDGGGGGGAPPTSPYNNNKYNKNAQNGKSPMKQPHIQDKKYMSADEIQTIHRLQAYQLHYTNPYIEDFYFQKLKERSGVVIQQFTHTPICDSLPKTITKKPTTTADPLLGALGRIPSHSIRAPRPILQIILDKDENEQYDKTVQSSDQTIKLAIESSYNHLLDIEDIDQLINNQQQSASTDNQQLIDLQAKKEQIAQDLFKSLHLDPFPCFKFESPLLPQQTPDQKWPSVCPEDLLFVSLWVIGKGRKLLNRAFLSLTSPQSVSALFAVCRNLPLLLMLHLPEGSEAATNGIYRTVSRWVMEIPIQFFTLAFHFLVNFNQPQFLTKVFSHRNGLAVIEQFLLRGYLVQDQAYLLHNNLQMDPVAVLQFHEIFGRFFQRLTGNFANIFSQQQPSQSPNIPPQPYPELVKIHSLLFHHSNEAQKNILSMELGMNNNNMMMR
ncbi:hypothetical protein DFA_07096 [Cavenderia fasciculata]|uniref:mRNA decay factor PAT1 domain-containing protein n=1 Tax=Cavenderia fasciculata TaxID=261658 RepID=F4PVG8_CACFS|nr:uncharacterized protein DFA_07096 [Cavenderia fasciculata]EGG19982.1 hypothetical protein DFA_07096 [Cavenderia fasciculata]|eukprot:XP_004366965.1 hypothetical protein DFA_07096 [Cavenderia fasciculata]